MANDETTADDPAMGRRKGDRRKAQLPFEGPDRRKAERRSGADRRKGARRSGADRRADRD